MPHIVGFNIAKFESSKYSISHLLNPASFIDSPVLRSKLHPFVIFICCGDKAIWHLRRDSSISDKTCSQKRNFPPGFKTRLISLRLLDGLHTEHKVKVQTTASTD